MIPPFSVLCLFLFLGVPILASADLKRQRDGYVQIDVLFEALCPDSISFLLGPLSDAFDEFGQHIRVELVPFGKATIHKDSQFVCQHGKYECQINKFLSCAIRYIENPLPFVICLESQLPSYREKDLVGWHQMAQDCILLVDLVSDTIAKIRNCADGNEGNALQLAAGKRTNSIVPDKITFVPWILWNNLSLADLQEQSRADLKPLICKHFEGTTYIGQCKGDH